MRFIKDETRNKNLIKAMLVALIVLVLLDLTPLGGNLVLSTKWIQCGHRPLHTSYGPGFEAGVPNYSNKAKFGIGNGLMPYYCSPREAELAGYSADPINYDFPHLNNEEWRQAYTKARAIQSRD